MQYYLVSLVKQINEADDAVKFQPTNFKSIATYVTVQR